MDAEGNILRLKEQDRSVWNKEMIARAMFHLAQSAAGDQLSEYHLQAGISACHCMADDYESTDWPQILSLYDQLTRIDGSPVVALNRAVAIAHVHGPEGGIKAVAAIPDRQTLDSYYLFHAVLAEFHSQLNDFQSAAAHLRKAIQLTELKSEQALLANRLRECEERSLRA